MKTKALANMAYGSKRKSTRYFHLFNCDKTCSLGQVKSLLRAVEGKVDFKIKVVEQRFSGHQIDTMVKKSIPQLKMDYAAFVLHANDNLTFGVEDSNYAKLYEAIKQGSGEKVLIVIEGDKNYKNKDEEEKNFISSLMNRTISTQLRKESLDGRKGFVFSWDEQHRPIHEDAILHFFDPSKKGQKFVHQPTLSMKNITVTLDPTLTPADVSEERRPLDNIEYNPQPAVDGGNEPITQTTDVPVTHADVSEERRPRDEDNPQPTADGEQESTTQAFTELSPTTYPDGTVLLATQMHYGVISDESATVTIRKDNKPWRLSESEAERLKNEYKSTSFAWFQLVAENGVVKSKVKEFTYVDHVRSRCSIS